MRIHILRFSYEIMSFFTSETKILPKLRYLGKEKPGPAVNSLPKIQYGTVRFTLTHTIESDSPR